jgi:uncharacterized membrane protein
MDASRSSTAIQNQQTENNSEHQVHQPKQPAWWQPAIDWMMHGNPILRVAVAVLMVGVVLLLRFASEHWQLSLGVKLSFIALVLSRPLLQVIYCKRKISYLLLLYKAWV